MQNRHDEWVLVAAGFRKSRRVVGKRSRSCICSGSSSKPLDLPSTVEPCTKSSVPTFHGIHNLQGPTFIKAVDNGHASQLEYSAHAAIESQELT